ncbi:MAG: hypothetical protein GKR87_09110 [Kiritimatiellae bacterium]|nr:hypothetical protein [Kiritimatiellia bacterium]
MNIFKKYGACIAILMATITTSYALDANIAVVDLDRIFTDYEKTKSADQNLQEKADEFNKDRKELIQAYGGLEETLNQMREDARNPAYNEETKEKRRDEAEEKLIELRDFEKKIREFDRSRKKELQSQSERIRNRIVKEIKSTIHDYAKTQNFSLVIDSSGQSLNAVSIMLYVEKDLDITDIILEKLNKSEPE